MTPPTTNEGKATELKKEGAACLHPNRNLVRQGDFMACPDCGAFLASAPIGESSPPSVGADVPTPFPSSLWDKADAINACQRIILERDAALREAEKLRKQNEKQGTIIDDLYKQLRGVK